MSRPNNDIHESREEGGVGAACWERNLQNLISTATNHSVCYTLPGAIYRLPDSSARHTQLIPQSYIWAPRHIHTGLTKDTRRELRRRQRKRSTRGSQNTALFAPILAVSFYWPSRFTGRLAQGALLLQPSRRYSRTPSFCRPADDRTPLFFSPAIDSVGGGYPPRYRVP